MLIKLDRSAVQRENCSIFISLIFMMFLRLTHDETMSMQLSGGRVRVCYFRVSTLKIAFAISKLTRFISLKFAREF